MKDYYFEKNFWKKIHSNKKPDKAEFLSQKIRYNVKLKVLSHLHEFLS